MIEEEKYLAKYKAPDWITIVGLLKINSEHKLSY